MMEDWTDIIGEELELVEEPLPADDWSVLQQKYAAARKRKKAAAFTWAGGITSVAAALALVLLLIRPDSSSVAPDLTDDPNNSVAEIRPLTETVVPVDVVKNIVADVIVAEKHIVETPIENTPRENIPTENTEVVFDVIRDTTSLKVKLLADSSTDNKKNSNEETYTRQAETFFLEDFPEDEPRRKIRPISISLSGSISDSPIFNEYNLFDTPMADADQPPYADETTPPIDSLGTDESKPAMMSVMSGYSDSYRHETPISFGVSARVHLTDRLSINTGLNYTRYKSLRKRTFHAIFNYQEDWQYVHYLGVPVRFDYLAVNKKHFNLYFGAGLQMDKCVYAKVGDERLYENKLLFGVNGAMGIQVNIVPLVGLYFEPEVSYALNKGSIETFRSEEPFVITIRGGLRFNF